MTEDTAPTAAAPAADGAAPEEAGFSAVMRRADTVRAVPEMDDISEFFRRDSRRYDRGFSGGNGL